jgi:predicted GH43/DUF377 family glycosyl hydrolase
MFSWKKLGHIYNPCDDENRPHWRWNFAQGINALDFDEFVRVYFCCREKPNEHGQTISRVCYADLDRADITRVVHVAKTPVLDVGELGCFDEHGVYPFSVVARENKVYGYYGGISRCESVPFNAAIGGAVSTDGGDSFVRMGKGPIVSYSFDEPFIVGSPKVRIWENRWYMFYSAGREWTIIGNRPEIYYKLRMATSDDGVNWSKCGKDIIEDKIGSTEAQACGDVLYKNGKYHMFFCYRANQDFRRNPLHSYRIGYAVSEDLYKWERKDELAGIDVSPDINAFDNEMVAYPHVFEVDGKAFMLYLGNEVGKYGFGIAELEGTLE